MAITTIVDPTGVDYSIVSISWTAVVSADDGSDLDVVTYQVMTSPDGVNWTQATAVSGDTTTATLPRILAGTSLQVAVRAIGTNGMSSELSTPVTVTLPGDNVPPPMAAVPTVVAKLGVLTVFWDGTFAGSGVKPADFFGVEVHMGTTTGFTPSSATLVGVLRQQGSVPIIGQAIGAVRFFVLVAKDVRGNAAAVSAQVTATVVGVSGPDIQANSLTANNVTAGFLDTQVMTGGTIRTAAPGIARVELNGSGVQVLSAANAVLSQVTPAGIDMTGTFRTATAAVTPRAEITSKAYTTSTGLGGAAYGTNGVYFYNDATSATAKRPVAIESSSDGSGFNTISITSGKQTGKKNVRMDVQSDNVTIWEQSADDSGATSLAVVSDSFISMGVSTGIVALTGAGGTINTGASPLIGGDPNVDTIDVQANTKVRMYVASAQRLALTGTGVTASGRVVIRPDGGSSNNFFVEQPPASSAINVCALDPAGVIALQVGSTPDNVLVAATGGVQFRVITNTTASANAVLAGGSNTLQRSTSLGEFKLDQKPIPVDYAILDLQAKTWTDKAQFDEDPGVTVRHAGFVAEDLRDLSTDHSGAFDALLSTDPDGSLRGIDYDRAVAFLMPVVRDMAKRIEVLEQRLNELSR